MSTSDQDGHAQLTRKQLRELRLTGSTPVITEEEAASAAQPAPTEPVGAEPAEPAAADAEIAVAEPAEPAVVESAEPAVAGPPEPVAGEPMEPAVVGPAEPVSEEPMESVATDAPFGAPLTRREMREQERARTASLPVQSGEPEDATADAAAEPVSAADDAAAALIQPRAAVDAGADAAHAAPWLKSIFDAPVVERAEADAPEVERPVSARESAAPAPAEFPPAPAADEERPVVGAAFGLGVKAERQEPRLPTVFDDLLDADASGSHKASNTLIFTPSPGVGSLSGPVASTGELLITGSYTLPDGLGSHGHAFGVADGKDADAVLIDGELAPSSSPTPIAASSAVSTSKPAGEVIRPPAPDKGNRLMLTLAIVAGGLALALATALIIAFVTGVFG